MEKLGTLSSEVVSRTEVDGRITTVVKTLPGMKLPRVVRPVLRGKEVEFVDTRTFLATDVGSIPFAQTFKSQNNITERAQVTGTIVIDHGEHGDTCVIRVQGECIVRITGLGSKIESIIVTNLKNAYKKLPEIIDEWMSIREIRMGVTIGKVLSPAVPSVSGTSEVSSSSMALLRTESNMSNGSESDSGNSFHSADSFELDSVSSGRGAGGDGNEWGTRGGEGRAFSSAQSSSQIYNPSTPTVGAPSQTPLPASRGPQNQAYPASTPTGSGLTPHFVQSDSPLDTPGTPFGGVSSASVTVNTSRDSFISASPVAGLFKNENANEHDEDIDSADERLGEAPVGGVRGRNAGLETAGNRHYGRIESGSDLGRNSGNGTRAGGLKKTGTITAVVRWCCCAPGQTGSPLMEEGGATPTSISSSDSLQSSPGDGDGRDPVDAAWDDETDLRTPLTPGGGAKRRTRR